MQNTIVTKLANRCLTEQHQAISYHQPDLSRQPNGLPNRRKPFSLIDFVIQCARLTRITFIAKYRAFLASYVLLLLYFGLMVSLFSRDMTSASSCFAKDKDASNATCRGNIEEDLLIRENVNYLTYVLLYTGMIISCTSALLYSSFVKVFRNEHRNCK